MYTADDQHINWCQLWQAIFDKTNFDLQEADNDFKDYNNLGSHETHDIDEWSHEVFDNTSPDYVGKDDYGDYYQ